MSENVFMFVINQPCEEQRFPHELLQWTLIFKIMYCHASKNC
jgi:hypothetical protein